MLFNHYKEHNKEWKSYRLNLHFTKDIKTLDVITLPKIF